MNRKISNILWGEEVEAKENVKRIGVSVLFLAVMATLIWGLPMLAKHYG